MSRSREAHREYMRNYRAQKREEAEEQGPEQAVQRPAEVQSETKPAEKSHGDTGTRGQGRHRKAVTRMLRATGLLHMPEEAMLVELLKDLADELDQGGGSRTYGAYIAAQRDLRRVLAYSGRPQSSADVAAPAVEEALSEPVSAEAAPVNSLAAFRQRRGIG